ncbi:MAG: hypothetical protein PUG67_01215 [Peptoniphilaceae bacterium]|nr:hypothetical protein [Peptoniphilaceae bacterium]MDY6018576.1 hypothetical protein [Anaerococcus sp.]
MNLYLINGEENEEKTKFAALLADKLSQDKKTLIIATQRSEIFNIEDYYKKDGMITYDICDYFLGYVDIDTIINKAYDKLDFIISPLVNGKYQIEKKDIDKLLGELSYDFLVFEDLDESFLDQKIIIDIISEDNLEDDLKGDYYFINKASANFDQRLYKDLLLAKKGKYLGFVNENGSYNNILDNLLNDRAEEIPNIGFFEKLKMKFKS